MANKIKNFTSKGKEVSGYRSASPNLTPGVRDPDTGRIIQGPKPQVDLGIKSGRGVRVTNPNATTGKQARRYRGIGAGQSGHSKT